MVIYMLEQYELLVFIGWVLVRIAEHRLHTNNYHYLLNNGGVEVISNVMKFFYFFQYFSIFLMFIEYKFSKNSIETSYEVAGIIIMIVSTLLRLIVFNKLGMFWTKRCIVIPGSIRIKSGIYQYLKHPEYVSRVSELVAFLLFFSSIYSFILSFCVVGILLLKIIKTEAYQLNRLSKDLSTCLSHYKLSRLDQG